MKKCPVCGVEHADNVPVCSICGTPLSAAPAPEQPSAPAAPEVPERPAAPDFADEDIRAAVSSVVTEAVSHHKEPESGPAPVKLPAGEPERPAPAKAEKPAGEPKTKIAAPADDDPFDDDSPFVVNAMRTTAAQRARKAQQKAAPAGETRGQAKDASQGSSRRPARPPRSRKPSAAPQQAGAAENPARGETARPAAPSAAQGTGTARPAAPRGPARPAASRHQPPDVPVVDTAAIAAASAQKVQEAKQNAMAAKARNARQEPAGENGGEEFNWSERKHPRRKAKSTTPVIAAVCALLALLIIAMIVLIGQMVTGDGDPNEGAGDDPNASVSDGVGDETGDTDTPDAGDETGDAQTPEDGTDGDETGDAQTPDEGETGDDAATPDDGTAGDETGDAQAPDEGETGDDAATPDDGAAGDETGDAQTPDQGETGDGSSDEGDTATERPALPEVTEMSDTVYATASVRVRDYPSTEYGEVINALVAGQAVNRTGVCSNGWTRVSIGGVTGYVFSDYLSATEPESGSDSGSDDGGSSESLDGITITEVNETVYTTAGVNVRSYPGSSGRVIATIAKGQAVTRTGVCSNGWSRVSVSGSTGYIFSDYLSTSQSGGSDGGSDSLDGITITEVNETVYATTGVNVRSYPGSSGRVITTLSRGQAVTRTGRCSNGWSRVSVGGKTGYVYSSYLSTSQSGGSDGGSGGGTSSSYILPDADSRVYSRSELSDLSASELRLARNELYARNGRRFNDSSLQEYFENKTWYSGTVDPDTFDANINSYLNDYELANLKLIIDLEKA